MKRIPLRIYKSNYPGFAKIYDYPVYLGDYRITTANPKDKTRIWEKHIEVDRLLEALRNCLGEEIFNQEIEKFLKK